MQPGKVWDEVMRPSSHFFSFFLLKDNIFKKIEVELIYTVNSCCTAKWLSYTHIYILFFNILFHSGLSQDISYNSLCCRVGPCCLSILHILVYIYQPQLPVHPFSTPTPLVKHKSDLYICEPIFCCEDRFICAVF